MALDVLTTNQLTPNIQNPNEIVSRLSSVLELGRTEILMYMVLLENGPMIASKLAKKMSIPRQRIYQHLEKLRNYGFVTMTFSSPSFYEAVKPRKAFSTALQKKEDESTSVRKIAEQVHEIFNNLGNSNSQIDLPKFNIIQGKFRIYATISKFLEKSTGTIYLVAAIDDLLRMYYTSIPEKIKICRENNATVKILTDSISEKSIPLLKKFNVNEIRVGDLPSKGKTIVEKGKNLLVSGSSDYKNIDIDTETIVCTDSPVMIASLYTLCEFMWNSSKIVYKEGR